SGDSTSSGTPAAAARARRTNAWRRRTPLAREASASIETTAAQAEGLASQGRFPDAERLYRELVSQTHVIDYEYDDWLRRLAEVYRHLRRRAEAGHIYLYLHYFDLARDAFGAEDAPLERARVLE